MGGNTAVHVRLMKERQRRLLKDEDLRRRMGRAALDRMKAEYLWSMLRDGFVRTFNPNPSTLTPPATHRETPVNESSGRYFTPLHPTSRTAIQGGRQ